MEQVLANGKVESNELELLRQAIREERLIDRRKAELLVEMHKRVQRVTPAFEHFFYQTMKEYLLRDGTVSAADADWTRRVLLTGKQATDQERKFLRELRGEAKSVSPEFQALCNEYLR